MQMDDLLAKCIDTHPLVEAFGLSPDVQECAFEVWIILFDFYFDFLGLQHHYTFRTNAITHEEKSPGKDDSEPRRRMQKENPQTNLMFSFHTPKKEKVNH